MSDFSVRLREERKRLSLSQEEMAAAGGVKLNAQSNYENGHRAPDADYLSKVSARGVDVGYLFTGSRAATPSIEGMTEQEVVPAKKELRELTPEQAALLDNYENADEEGRDAARRVLVALSKSKASRKAA